jgi:hypothetical protein
MCWRHSLTATPSAYSTARSAGRAERAVAIRERRRVERPAGLHHNGDRLALTGYLEETAEALAQLRAVAFFQHEDGDPGTR